ncbi:MAG: hypothetical protein K6T83_07045 [Alicyclobacillus sp.]|nr:hypothetical protein [Alicyclobacillus sp.]
MKGRTTILGAAAILILATGPASLASSRYGDVQTNHRVLSVGSYNEIVTGVVSRFGRTESEFLSVDDVIQGLASVGYQASWNVSRQELNITTPPAVSPNLSHIHPEEGEASISINGRVVLRTVAVQFKGISYLPIVSLSSAFQRADLHCSYDGTVWRVSLTANILVATPTVGSPARIADLHFNVSHPTVGQRVVVSGVVEDARGHPVRNTSLLLTVLNNSGGATYATGSEWIEFPDAQVVVGTPATYSYGLPVTSDANGRFAVVLREAKSGTDEYALWPVKGGLVSGNPISGKDTGYTFALTWEPGNNLTHIAVYGSVPAQVSANDPASISSIQGQIGQAVEIYFAPVTYSGPLMNQSYTYQIVASHGAVIQSLDRQALAKPVSATTVTMKYVGDGTYSLGVPGGFANGKSSISVDANNAPLPDDPALFSVGVEGTTTGNATLTVSNGSEQATAMLDILPGIASRLGGATPVRALAETGQSTTVTLTVTDEAGNPVMNTQVPVTVSSAADPLWLTAVNGVTLEQTEPTGNGAATEPTPIPLYQPGINLDPNGYWTGSGDTIVGPYTLVSIPGLIADAEVGTSGTESFDVYTNAQGQVSLTFQDGNVSYYTGGSTSPYTHTSDTMGAGTGILHIGYGTVDGQFSIILSGETMPVGSTPVDEVIY